MRLQPIFAIGESDHCLPYSAAECGFYSESRLLGGAAKRRFPEEAPAEALYMFIGEKEEYGMRLITGVGDLAHSLRDGAIART